MPYVHPVTIAVFATTRPFTFSGQMAEAFLDSFGEFHDVAKRPHSDYTDMIKRGKLDNTFKALAHPSNLPYGTMALLNKRTSVPVETLRDWRKRLLEEPESQQG